MLAFISSVKYTVMGLGSFFVERSVFAPDILQFSGDTVSRKLLVDFWKDLRWWAITG
jgi:hypothetical protein